MWDDLCGSDHFPLIITSRIEETAKTSKKANWNAFQALCYERFNNKTQDQEDSVKWFTNTLITVAEKTIPKTSTKHFKRQNPWFDDKCKNLIEGRKKAVRIFKQQPTAENLKVKKSA